MSGNQRITRLQLLRDLQAYLGIQGGDFPTELDRSDVKAVIPIPTITPYQRIYGGQIPEGDTGTNVATFTSFLGEFVNPDLSPITDSVYIDGAEKDIKLFSAWAKLMYVNAATVAAEIAAGARLRYRVKLYPGNSGIDQVQGLPYEPTGDQDLYTSNVLVPLLTGLTQYRFNALTSFTASTTSNLQATAGGNPIIVPAGWRCEILIEYFNTDWTPRAWPASTQITWLSFGIAVPRGLGFPL